MMRMHCVYQNLTLITLTSLIAQVAKIASRVEDAQEELTSPSASKARTSQRLLNPSICRSKLESTKRTQTKTRASTLWGVTFARKGPLTPSSAAAKLSSALLVPPVCRLQAKDVIRQVRSAMCYY